jgi:hypothetical protein
LPGATAHALDCLTRIPIPAPIPAPAPAPSDCSEHPTPPLHVLANLSPHCTPRRAPVRCRHQVLGDQVRARYGVTVNAILTRPTSTRLPIAVHDSIPCPGHGTLICRSNQQLYILERLTHCGQPDSEFFCTCVLRRSARPGVPSSRHSLSNPAPFSEPVSRGEASCLLYLHPNIP